MAFLPALNPKTIELYVWKREPTGRVGKRLEEGLRFKAQGDKVSRSRFAIMYAPKKHQFKHCKMMVILRAHLLEKYERAYQNNDTHFEVYERPIS